MSDATGRLHELLDLRDSAPAVAVSEATFSDFLLFELGGVTFALEARHVEEVIGWRRPFPLPRADRRVAGIIQDRGRIVVVLARPEDGDGARALRIIVCRTQRGYLGFCADKTRCVASVKVYGDLVSEAVLDTSEGVVTFLDPGRLVAVSA